MSAPAARRAGIALVAHLSAALAACPGSTTRGGSAMAPSVARGASEAVPAGRSAMPAPPPSALADAHVTAPEFVLRIERVEAARLGAGLLFRARATLTNRSGRTLRAYTNFGSVFDGLALLVCGPDGTPLVRHGYVDHQSPYAEHRAIPVPVGDTTEDLGVPVDDLPASASRVRVRFEGRLPGVAGGPALVSNTVVVQIPPP